MRYRKRKLTKLALTKQTRQQYAVAASYELMERGLLYRGTIPGSGFRTTLPTAIDLTKKGH